VPTIASQRPSPSGSNQSTDERTRILPLCDLDVADRGHYSITVGLSEGSSRRLT